MIDRSHAEDVPGHGDRLFRALVEHSSDITVLVNLQGSITYVSPAITSIMGYSPDEVSGKHALTLVHPDDRPYIQQLLAQLQQTPGLRVKAEARLLRQDGSWCWCEATATNLLHEPDIGAIVGSFHDVSRRKETEISLKNELERAEMAQEAGSVGIFEWDVRLNHLVWTPENDALYTAPPDTSEGNYADWVRYIQPDDLATTEMYLYELFSQKAEQFSSELRILPPNQPLLWMLVKGRIEYDAEQQPRRLVGISIDITERKQVEEERIAIDRRKDEFISLASHELRTPLTSLKGYAQLLKKKVEQQGLSDHLFFLERMDRQINRLTKLIQDLLDVSRVQMGRLNYTEETFALDELIEEIREMVQGNSRHQLIFKQHIPLHVYGDRDRIGQVLINLLTNATKYSPNADKVLIRARQEREDAIVSIQDFGIGIAENEQEKVFERFYRVHDAAEHTFPGLGIGLYICHEIIQRHQGELWIESQKGKGSTFSFRLPLHRLTPDH